MQDLPSRKTWEEASAETKQNLLFDMAVDTNKRIRKVEKRKLVDAACSLGGGFMGGLSAVWLKIKFFGL